MSSYTEENVSNNSARILLQDYSDELIFDWLISYMKKSNLTFDYVSL